MADPEITRIAIPLHRDLLERIDEHRFTRRIASRAEAIRQLLEVGLEATAKQPSRKTAAR